MIKAKNFPIGTIKKIKGNKKIVKLIQPKGKQTPYHKWVKLTDKIININYGTNKLNKLAKTIKIFVK